MKTFMTHRDAPERQIADDELDQVVGGGDPDDPMGPSGDPDQPQTE